MSANSGEDVKNKKRQGSKNNPSLNSKAVLLVYPSQLSIPRLADLAADIKLALRAKKVEFRNVELEENAIIFEMDDVVEGAAIASKRFGAEKVAIARKLRNAYYAQICSEIVRVGKLKVLPHEKFFIKVQISKNAKVNYKPRDLEFASTGDLISALMSTSPHSNSENVSQSSKAMYVRPARNEIEANRLLDVYVGKNSAYICIESDKGLGGLPFGCQKEKVMCAVYDTMSCICCVLMMKCGFIPEIVIIYTDDDTLRQNLKMLGFVINKLQTRKYSIRLARLKLPGTTIAQQQSELMPVQWLERRILTQIRTRREREREQQQQQQGQVQRELQRMSYHIGILKSLVAIRVLSQMNEKNVALPLSTAIHPLWLIESVFKQVGALNKVPWMPLLLPSQNIQEIMKELENNEYKPFLFSSGIFNQDESALALRVGDYKRYSRIIYKLSEEAMNNMKFISFEIGPNYLHDILDSI